MTPTPEMLKLARSIVKQHYPEMPANYRGRRFQIALAAIVEVTERAAKLAMDRVDSGIDPNTYSLGRQEAHNIATALRNMEHLK